ncbi:unnamed protein product, partial [Phaeothamnion confervicola]
PYLYRFAEDEFFRVREQVEYFSSMTYFHCIKIAQQMRHELPLKSRERRGRMLPLCFHGIGAVAWMRTTGVAAHDAEAVAIGNALMRAGLLHHVGLRHAFQASRQLYRFPEDETALIRERKEQHRRRRESLSRRASDVGGAASELVMGLRRLSSAGLTGSFGGVGTTGSGGGDDGGNGCGGSGDADGDKPIGAAGAGRNGRSGRRSGHGKRPSGGFGRYGFGGGGGDGGYSDLGGDGSDGESGGESYEGRFSTWRGSARRKRLLRPSSLPWLTLERPPRAGISAVTDPGNGGGGQNVGGARTGTGGGGESSTAGSGPSDPTATA